MSAEKDDRPYGVDFSIKPPPEEPLGWKLTLHVLAVVIGLLCLPLLLWLIISDLFF